jgi:hypothetical protein
MRMPNIGTGEIDMLRQSFESLKAMSKIEGLVDLRVALHQAI